MAIAQLRREYHQRICEQIVRLQKDGSTTYPNFADKGNKASRAIALGIVKRLGFFPSSARISGQATGRLFESITRDFLREAFALLHHLRPGNWYYSIQAPISDFEQYEHLARLEHVIRGDNELASALGKDYIITPDIVVGRQPVSDEEINREGLVHLSVNGSLV